MIAQKNGHGIGLKNVQRRLELLYQNRFRLKVSRSSESYQVNLEIILSES
jgi:sensor histidine kinase YesM